MVQNSSAKRGRPRAYDPDLAIAQAMAVFWDAGYAATSLDDLAAGTGMNRPSLYGAFGDKRALYRLALERYRDQAKDAIRAALRYDLPVRAAFAELYDRALALYLSGDQGPRGCFLIGTALTESVLDDGVRTALADALRQIDAAFEARIGHAVETGELPRTTDIGVLACLASALLYSLSIRARSGTPRSALEATVRGALDVLFARRTD